MQTGFKRVLVLSCLAVSLALTGCGKTAAPAAGGFDVPAVIGQDFESAQGSLGKPSETQITNDSGGAARYASWEDAQGNSLSVFYGSVSKKPASVMLTIPDAQASPDKDKVLKAGNLSIDDARYSLKFTLLDKDENKVVGVAVKPLTP
jgi:hypothetical protein